MAMEGSTLAAGGRQGLAAPLHVLGDEALMRLAARGNQAAFSVIFDRHHQALYRYALTILGNREDAFDAVQNAILKLLRSLPGEQRDLKLKPWLYRIVHNEAISMIRQRAPRSEGAVEDLGAEDSNHDRLRAQAIIADLSTLGEQQRSAVAMRELNGLSHAEIGGALKISEAAAKQAVYEGRVALQQIEEGREMACSEVQKSLSANDRRLVKSRRVRSHLRSCAACRSFQESIRERRSGLAGIAPLPVALSAKLLSGALGGGGGPAGGLMVGAGTTGAGHMLGVGALAKVGAAAVLMVGGGIVIDREVGKSDPAPETARSNPTHATPEPPKPLASAALSGDLHRSTATADSARSGGGEKAGPNANKRTKDSAKSNGAEPSRPAAIPAPGNGPAHGQAIAAANDPGHPGNSAGHAQNPASPPGLDGQAATPQAPATPAVAELPAAATEHGQGLGPKKP